MADAAIHGHDHEDERGFFTRWFMSTNHKDIGILYLVVSAVVGFISVAFTVYMRMELMEPGVAGVRRSRHLQRLPFHHLGVHPGPCEPNRLRADRNLVRRHRRPRLPQPHQQARRRAQPARRGHPGNFGLFLVWLVVVGCHGVLFWQALC